MARQKRTPGAVLEIKVDDQYYCYAQVLLQSGCAFFDLRSSEKLVDLAVLLQTPILFILGVYTDVITQGHWLKVGKLEIRHDLKEQPMKFIQDVQKPERFELYNPNTGAITAATKAECKGLERCAVWDKHHVEQRLSDYYAGRPNYERQLDLKVFEE